MYKVNFLLMCAIAIFLFLQVDSKSLDQNKRSIKLSDINDTRYTSEIIRLAKVAELRSSMNENINPCVDFYEFACGNWNHVNPSSRTKTTTGFFDNLKLGLNRKISTMLHADVKANDTSTDKKVKQFYASCMQRKNQLAEQQAELRNIIEEFGQMPALVGNDWNDKDFDWLETVAKISHKYVKDIIISTGYARDFVNTSRNMVFVLRPSFQLQSKSIYIDAANEVYRNSSTNSIAKQLVFLLNVNQSEAHQVASEIMEFEIDLAQGMEDEKTGLTAVELSTLTTVEAMQEKYAPIIDIKKLVNISLGELITEPIYEFNAAYQENLLKVIPKVSKRVLANYIYYTLISDFIWVPGTKSEASIEGKCLGKTKSYFAKIMDNMVYRQFDTKHTENGVNTMWQEITKTFKAQLSTDKYNWINAATRNYAIEKLAAVKMSINSYEPNNFTTEFADFVIDSENFVRNIANIKASEKKIYIAALHKPPKPYEDGETLSFTPVNIVSENIIRIPVAVLQPYYIWADAYPNALKFGNLGALIGHELIHGFDDIGRKFDKYGNSHDWWDVNSTQAFEERTKCFSEQYSQFSYGGRLLPKSTLQSENIADNGGLRIAYAAYLRWYEDALRSGEDLHLEVLPSMDYSSQQLFFISFAQMWCNDVLSSIQAFQAATDVHTPGKFRAIGALANFAEFAKAFKCAAGSAMNPQEKCEIY